MPSKQRELPLETEEERHEAFIEGWIAGGGDPEKAEAFYRLLRPKPSTDMGERD